MALIELDNARLLYRRKSNIPLVTIAIGARYAEDGAHAGLTGLMARTSIKGTSRRTAEQIAIEAEGMGGSISPSVGADMLDWEITVPARHFERALELLADVVFHAAFHADALAIEQKLALADLQHSRDDMYRYPVRLCFQQAFRGHRYGHSLAQIERGLTQATPETLRAWHAQCVQPEPWFAVVGDVSEAEVTKGIASVLPVFHPALPPAPAPAPAVWAGPSAETEPRDKAQSALALAFPGPARNHEDVHDLQVLAHAVGGLGGRLFEELRSTRSLAYTVSLMPVARVQAGAFIGYIATAPEREAEARAALLEQLERLRQEPLPASEVARAQRYTLGTWQIRSQTNGAQLGDLLHAFMLGPGMSEITEFERHIMAVTPETMQRAAQRWLDPAQMVEGVIRGGSK